MKSLVLTIGALAAALSLAVELNSALAANHSNSAGVKVSVASSGLGRILVDGRGRTLYLFEKDKHGKSACTGQCAGFWPPLIASGKPLATAGAKASLLGTTRRGDGRLQVTYNHHPLYTFVKDTRKGQTNGEEVDAFRRRVVRSLNRRSQDREERRQDQRRRRRRPDTGRLRLLARMRERRGPLSRTALSLRTAPFLYLRVQEDPVVEACDGLGR
jgi:predicted lipoprotein with Yx(FWY)xxD motif